MTMATVEELEQQVKELKQIGETLKGHVNKQIAIEYRYANTLEWIRFLAGLHYMGDAFEPEHMRAIANMAADALNYEFKPGSNEFKDDGRFLGDFEEATEKAKKLARKWAAVFHRQIDEMQRPLRKDEEDEEPEDGK